MPPAMHASRRLACPCQARAGTPIRIASRGSHLAKLQAEQVALLLRKVRPEWGPEAFEMVTIATHGDREREALLRNLGQGAFTEAIDQAVARGEVDLGVHSLKDSPVELPQAVRLAACLPRDDPRDAFISLKARTLADLPSGARVGTSSLRRKAQLLAAHSQIKVVPVRGNIDHRLQLLERGELDAIVLAAAGLSRLGQTKLITRVLDSDEMLPAVCQGALGVTCNAGDDFLNWELGLICHEPTRLEVEAERAMLAALLEPDEEELEEQQQQQPTTPSGAPTISGISSVTGLKLLPCFAVAGNAQFDAHDGRLRLTGLVASEDGRTLHRLSAEEVVGSPADAGAVGRGLGRQLRALARQHGWLDALGK